MYTMRNLQEIRKEIDAIDHQLLPLFCQRMSIMSEVAQAKKAAGIPLTDAAREEEILTRLSAAYPEFAEEIRSLYQQIFKISKARQAEKSAQ